MTQLGEAVARYHRILTNAPDQTTGWLGQLREQMAARRLMVNGRPVTPVLRPHFLSRRQYTSLVKSAEALQAAIDRVRRLALATPALLQRMDLLPAERMLASVDPGYAHSSVASLLNTQVDNGSMHLTGCKADLPSGVVFHEALSDLFFDTPPMREFRKRYKLEKTGGVKPLLSSLLKAYKEFGGKNKPVIGILEVKQPFASAESLEYQLLAEYLCDKGLQAAVVSPDQLEYRNGKLTRGGVALDLIYRGVAAQEFLLRFDLTHALVQAYRDRAVCVVNSFRSEVTRKKALFDLLTDPEVTADFPAAEKAAIANAIPWTRRVVAGQVRRGNAKVDLLDYIVRHRAGLVLRPNDESSERPSFTGNALDDASWERALKTALRSPYVVQEYIAPKPIEFPVELYGELAWRQLNVEVHPHTFLGKVQGCSSHIVPAASGFSSLVGVAPTYILEVK